MRVCGIASFLFQFDVLIKGPFLTKKFGHLDGTGNVIYFQLRNLTSFPDSFPPFPELTSGQGKLRPLGREQILCRSWLSKNILRMWKEWV